VARNNLAKTSITEDGKSGVIEFTDGTARVIDPTGYPEEIVQRATVTGFITRLRQGFSDAETAAEAIKLYDELNDQLLEGVWSSRGKGETRVGLLVEAISRIKNLTLAEVEAKLQTLQDHPDQEKAKAALKALRSDPQVKQIVAKIRLERAEKDAATATEDESSDVLSMFG
jgi:hypothetical protein